MSEFTLIFYDPADTQAARLERAVSLTLTRERYTPFYTLEYSFIADDHGADINDFVSVRLMYGSTSIFYGRAASLRMTRRAGSDIISGRAFSFTKTLSTCDAVPGMMFDCTLADIIANNASMPNISLQQVSDSASYIFVKESDTVWSAIAALSVKLFEGYPFITGENTVNIKKIGGSPHSYVGDPVTEVFSGENMANAVSKIYMQGTQGTYEFSATDREAVRRGIIRERFIPLDRQWLSSPETGLKHKMYFARRGGIYTGFTYRGFKNEQLCDPVSFSHGEFSYSGEVSRLVLHADRRGIFTTVTSYKDGYSDIVIG